MPYKTRIRLALSPDAKDRQARSRVLELPKFLKSRGLNPANTNIESLIEITDVALTRTARVSSYFVSLLISYICSMAFWEVSTMIQSSLPDIGRTISSALVALIACLVVLIVLPVLQQEQIRLTRLKNDLITAKVNGLID